MWNVIQLPGARRHFDRRAHRTVPTPGPATSLPTRPLPSDGRRLSSGPESFVSLAGWLCSVDPHAGEVTRDLSSSDWRISLGITLSGAGRPVRRAGLRPSSPSPELPSAARPFLPAVQSRPPRKCAARRPSDSLFPPQHSFKGICVHAEVRSPPWPVWVAWRGDIEWAGHVRRYFYSHSANGGASQMSATLFLLGLRRQWHGVTLWKHGWEWPRRPPNSGHTQPSGALLLSPPLLCSPPAELG